MQRRTILTHNFVGEKPEKNSTRVTRSMRCVDCGGTTGTALVDGQWICLVDRTRRSALPKRGTLLRYTVEVIALKRSRYEVIVHLTHERAGNSKQVYRDLRGKRAFEAVMRNIYQMVERPQKLRVNFVFPDFGDTRMQYTFTHKGEDVIVQEVK